jgi:hypothetical protein
MNKFVIYDNITGQYLAEFKNNIPWAWEDYYWDIQSSARFSNEKAQEIKKVLESSHEEGDDVHYIVEEKNFNQKHLAVRKVISSIAYEANLPDQTCEHITNEITSIFSQR